MPHKNTTTDRPLHSVARTNDAPTTEEKVRAVLAAKPGSTTTELALAAGVGRSTAAKILARWDRDGAAMRAAGDGPRKPDTWTLVPSDTGTTAPEPQDTLPDATAHTDSEDKAAPTAAVSPHAPSDLAATPTPPRADHGMGPGGRRFGLGCDRV
ncbi:helix-turn-helix domain-containing protein [Amycolatopsis sp. NPDC051128]|uniref:helix-turn-helix domain-containing protein n=1 Tax=Amycolatopsis sp. NPDC051128 TaxID=3155412 RepID=UPI003413BC6D